jgi:hypothetical protein
MQTIQRHCNQKDHNLKHNLKIHSQFFILIIKFQA